MNKETLDAWFDQLAQASVIQHRCVERLMEINNRKLDILSGLLNGYLQKASEGNGKCKIIKLKP